MPNRTPTTSETVTGKLVDIANPDPETICIEDIGWSLSRINRFNGMTVQVLPYSVGQHSIVVAEEAVKRYLEIYPDATAKQKARIFLLGLLHDADEPYTGDISGPCKKIPELRPIIKAISKRVQDAIYIALDIEAPSDDEEHIVKYGDLLAQKVEAYNFMPSRGIGWEGLPEVSIIRLQQFENPLPATAVYLRFIELYNFYMRIYRS